MTNYSLRAIPSALTLLMPEAIKETLKTHFDKHAEVVQQLLLAELKSGAVSLSDIAEQDKFIGGYYRIVDAALKGVTNRNLRLMCKILRNTFQQTSAADEINRLLSIVAELSEEEVTLLANLWKCKKYYDDANLPYHPAKLTETLVPNTYTKVYLDALLMRLIRTGLVIAKSAYGGLIIHPSPLLETFVRLSELQIHNNST